MFQSFLKDNRKNGKDGVRTYRSADAQKFLDRVKTPKPKREPTRKLTPMEKWERSIDAEMDYAIAHELLKP